MAQEWTDEQVATLKKLWAEGIACSQIAIAIGGVTRNAVIGKAHRMKLPPRLVEARKAEDRPRRYKPKITLAKAERPTWTPADIVHPKPATTKIPAGSHIGSRSIDAGPGGEADTVALPKPATVASAAGPSVERLTIMDLRDKHCRWPLWKHERPDPRTALFCSAPTDGGPWCEHHRQVCTEAARPVRRAA